MASRPRLKTPISYYGGKQNMLKYILPLIPKHRVYTEPFCGGGAVFFAKEPSECEVINDKNTELINFYKVARTDYESLKKEIDGTLHSRDLHAHARHINTYPSFFSPLQRAWAIWACTKMGFSSMIDGTFGYDRSGTTSMKISNGREQFTELICKRLSKTIIENEDGLNVIQRYDCPDAFHFIDPPYINTDCGHYAGIFNEQNFNSLLEILSRVDGKFMLTMFPNSLIKEYREKHSWVIHPVERCITASKEKRRRQEEWIITNY